MHTDDQDLWLTAFDKTGFALEYQVQQVLREHGWNVINSRYYIDDKTGAEREIDVVAYKTRLTGDTPCCTYLIISCKKASKSSWVFLTSDSGDAGEDFDPCPLGIVASAPGIQRLVSAEKPLAVSLLTQLEPYRKICEATHKVLSFQQFHRESCKPEDDKQIFASIITSIKAAAYEKKYALAHRRGGAEVCLDFHLLSVFEGGLKENYRSGAVNEVRDVREIKYINRHIIENTDRFYRVHFIDSGFFEEAVGQYDRAAEALPSYYAALEEEFYGDIFSPEKKARLAPFWKTFTDELFHEMFEERYCEDDRDYYNNSWLTDWKMDRMSGALVLYWDMSFISDPREAVAEMNKNGPLRDRTARKLEEHFRYTGPFRFALDPNTRLSW